MLAAPRAAAASLLLAAPKLLQQAAAQQRRASLPAVQSHTMGMCQAEGGAADLKPGIIQLSFAELFRLLEEERAKVILLVA